MKASLPKTDFISISGKNGLKVYVVPGDHFDLAQKLIDMAGDVIREAADLERDKVRFKGERRYNSAAVIYKPCDWEGNILEAGSMAFKSGLHVPHDIDDRPLMTREKIMEALARLRNAYKPSKAALPSRGFKLLKRV